MSRKAVMDRVYENLNRKFTREDVREVVIETFSSMMELLLEGETLKIQEFGKFWLELKGEREAKNPYTKEIMTVPPRRYFRFRPSSGIKEKLRKESLST